MVDESLVGMWRYARNRKLNEAIRKAQLKRLVCLLEDNADSIRTLCGTKLSSDCPFALEVDEVRNGFGVEVHLHQTYCLAPDNGYNGCYLLPYCRKGLENYKKHKFRRA